MTDWKNDLHSRELLIIRGAEAIATEAISRLEARILQLEEDVEFRGLRHITVSSERDERGAAIKVALAALKPLIEAKERRTHADVRQELREIRQALEAVYPDVPF